MVRARRRGGPQAVRWPACRDHRRAGRRGPRADKNWAWDIVYQVGTIMVSTISTSTTSDVSRRRVVGGAAAMGRWFDRPTAMNPATAARTTFAGTSAYSPRRRWKPAARTIVSARPAAASGVSLGLTLVMA